ncbi:hypothetical protein DEO72_LG8g2583 [Vigna unguiculata]|uniref:Uncharacterized protein n=1 Tax=Vigna unguiculata TaxID=3917 RepID=A0A4D6MXE5_VIGUN|nr:hypothetical protein DEO72_LG8g2583 [Vigna unguiculata]
MEVGAAAEQQNKHSSGDSSSSNFKMSGVSVEVTHGLLECNRNGSWCDDNEGSWCGDNGGSWCDDSGGSWCNDNDDLWHGGGGSWRGDLRSKMERFHGSQTEKKVIERFRVLQTKKKATKRENNGEIYCSRLSDTDSPRRDMQEQTRGFTKSCSSGELCLSEEPYLWASGCLAQARQGSPKRGRVRLSEPAKVS